MSTPVATSQDHRWDSGVRLAREHLKSAVASTHIALAVLGGLKSLDESGEVEGSILILESAADDLGAVAVMADRWADRGKS